MNAFHQWFGKIDLWSAAQSNWLTTEKPQLLKISRTFYELFS